jgi:hypothetical protein
MVAWPEHESISAMASRGSRPAPTAVSVELGRKRVFASALSWPGWCRSGKTEEAALEALAAYVPRYAVVAKEAGLPFPGGVADAVEVVERIPGTATTDFGAPGEVAPSDAEPVPAAAASRFAALLTASWAVFDGVAASAPPQLRKGPRGGGRDRDKMIDHVLAAEAAYARKFGVKHRSPAIDDKDAIAALRAAIIEVLGAPSDGAPLAPKGWPQRYAVRRVIWHVLDHAWEMEDRAEPA